MNDTKNFSGRARGRPRGFDRDAALAAAMRLFWQHGYEATSVATLCETLGVTPPQLYNAFGDKQRLFEAAVELYLDKEARFATDALTAETGAIDAMRALLAGAARAYGEEGKPAGCLFVAGALAVGPQSDAIATLLRNYRAATRDAVEARLAEGQAKGEIAASVDVGMLARFIVGTLYGMSVQARDGVVAADLAQLAEVAASVVESLAQMPSTPGARTTSADSGAHRA